MKDLKDQLIEKLRRRIFDIKNYEEPMDSVGWGAQEGVLITGEEAELFIKLLESAQEDKEEHATCDGCARYIDDLCHLNVCVYNDCNNFSQWTAKEEKKPVVTDEKIESMLNLVTHEFVREYVSSQGISASNISLHGCHCLIYDFAKDIVIAKWMRNKLTKENEKTKNIISDKDK